MNVHNNRLVAWRTCRKERKTETERRIRSDKVRETILNQRRDRNQLESITEQRNRLKYEAFTKSSQRYVQSLIQTKEECKTKLSNEPTRKRIQQVNRDLVNCLIYLQY